MEGWRGGGKKRGKRMDQVSISAWVSHAMPLKNGTGEGGLTTQGHG